MSKTDKASKVRIRVLPEVVQNKIAAGEVVERPASVVKELIENAIDAGASSISVELEDGGHRLVRVTDDGSGMPEDELLLSVQRHATSKITDVDDIFRISTMGFRGEALPSIGSVSKLSITSAVAGAANGYRVMVEGGNAAGPTPAPPRKGTAVEVRELFYNTPARRKFMKSQSAEVSAINETVTRLSLAHPGVSFRIDNGGKMTLEVPAHNALTERIATLFGSDIANRLLPVFKDNHEGLRIEGFASKPPESRGNSRNIYLYLNRRWIRHPGLIRVVTDAYRGSLPPRRYPFAVLYLTVDPQQVDVNVHPTKQEVRFENEQLIVGSVRRAVDAALAPPVQQHATVRPPQNDTPTVQDPPQAAVYNAVREWQDRPQPQPRTFSAPRSGISPQKTESPAAQGKLPIPATPKHRVLAQAGEKYLVVESEDGICLVDQHAIHERWNFEKLRDSELPISSQRLLIPVVVELSPAEAALFKEAIPVLQEIGFEVEIFGSSSLSVSAVPEIVKQSKVEQLIRDVFADIENGGSAYENLRDELAASLACRSAVLFGSHLPREQLIALMDKFDEAKQPLTCPHGRPTMITITWEELERRFGR